MQSTVVISLLLPISSTGDGCCSCQNLRTVSFREVCKVFWVQPIELRCGVAVTAFQVPAKAAGSATLSVSATQHGVRAAKSEARELGEEGWPVGAVLLTVDMLWGGKDGSNFGVGMCSEIWLRWEGPPLYTFRSTWNPVYITSFGHVQSVSETIHSMAL